MKAIKFYVKQTFVPFVYLIFVSVISMAIMYIDDSVLPLKIVLGVLNLGLYAVVVFGMGYKMGQEGLKARVSNDTERRNIIRTGEDRPLKLHEEYKWWKGGLFGFIVCIPLVLLLIVHAVLTSINPAYFGAGTVASWLYLVIYSFVIMFGGQGLYQAPAQAYFGLLAIPIIMLILGVSYYLGARKIQRQQDAIKEIHRDIYGE